MTDDRKNSIRRRGVEYLPDEAVRYNAVLVQINAGQIAGVLEFTRHDRKHPELLELAAAARRAASVGVEEQTMISTEPKFYADLGRQAAAALHELRKAQPDKVQNLMIQLTHRILRSCEAVQALSGEPATPKWQPSRETVNRLDRMRELEPEVWEDY